MPITLDTFKAVANSTVFSSRDIVVQGEGKTATAKLGNFIFSQGKTANNATMAAFKEALEREYGSLGTHAFDTVLGSRSQLNKPLRACDVQKTLSSLVPIRRNRFVGEVNRQLDISPKMMELSDGDQKAIRKILPYMRDYGLIYSHAVFLGNLKDVLPSHVWGVPQVREAAIEKVIEVLLSVQQTSDARTQEQCVKDFLKERYQVDDKALDKLYHPSMIDLYPRVKPNDKGIYQLGSPRISSVRNPMAMHSLFRLRKVVNLLLEKGYIDEETTIHIEFSRDLNDANRRWAIQQWQRQNEKERDRCKKEIEKLFQEATGKQIVEVTDRDILKYQLWEEHQIYHLHRRSYLF